MFAALRSALLLPLIAAGGLCLAAQPEPAALPEQRVDAALPAQLGAVIAVRAGGDLQDALDRAVPGDVIELEAGAEFHGPFTLPHKNGDAWIVIRSAALDRLPPAGTRVDPSYAPNMPVLSADSGAVVSAAPGAHHYRFIGVEIRPARGTFLYNLVELGNGSEQRDALPHHIVFDRCYVHGDAAAGTRRGLAMNSAHTAVVDSWFADLKEQGADSQAIASWNGAGPFLIANNYLEAAGENLMFGGAVPAIADLVPTDIEVRGNHLAKNPGWKADEPGYEGTPWTVKNLFELKNARRVLVDGNVLERNWAQGQNGMAVLMTVRNESGAAPWATVEDVTFSNNVITGVAGGINILGHDDNGRPSGRASRLVIRNNLFLDMGGRWGEAPLLLLLEGATDLTIEDNTAFNTGSIINSEGEPHTNVSFSRNIVRHNQYGIVGSGTGPGKQTLDKYFPGIVLEHNIIVGGNGRSLPGENAFPVADTDVGFLDRDAGDFRLDPARKLRRGETIETGVDLPALCAALAPTERELYCPAPVAAEPRQAP